MKHNHVTRDIKPQGECPGCDDYYKSKPREFWISPDRKAKTPVEYETEPTENLSVFCADYQPIDDDAIHVIEYSAYDGLKKEYYKLQKRFEAEYAKELK